ncbi:CAP domain-containing protein, partial [Cellulosilyticum ruminicola]|uniref:CAP domain-containing protein n=1 Tax=Cellulosilyticum ruminicola TaxID=425254 RepID=UPI000AB08424
TKPETSESETNQAAFENEVLRLVNIERSKQGLSALQMDENVRNVAKVKATDMYKNKYFSHTSPTYGSPFDMMKKFGITYKAAAENIAQGQITPAQVVNTWMNSSGHRANILNSKYTHIGIGYEANGNNWVQMFISK